MTRAETDQQLRLMQTLQAAYADRPIVVAAAKRKANRLRRQRRHNVRHRPAPARPTGRPSAPERREEGGRSSARSGDSGEPHEPWPAFAQRRPA